MKLKIYLYLRRPTIRHRSRTFSLSSTNLFGTKKKQKESEKIKNFFSSCTFVAQLTAIHRGTGAALHKKKINNNKKISAQYGCERVPNKVRQVVFLLEIDWLLAISENNVTVGSERRPGTQHRKAHMVAACGMSLEWNVASRLHLTYHSPRSTRQICDICEMIKGANSRLTQRNIIVKEKKNS